MNEHEKDRVLDQMLAALPTAVEPDRDLWPGIEQRLGERQAARATPLAGWMGGMAASLALAAVVAVTALSLARFGAAPEPGEQVAALPADTVPVAGSGGLAPQVMAVPAQFPGGIVFGPGYQKDHALLAERFEQQLETLPPETREAVRKNLTDIRQALQQINGVLAQHPDNALLQEMLLATYREELAMFIRVDRLSSGREQRTDL